MHTCIKLKWKQKVRRQCGLNFINWWWILKFVISNRCRGFWQIRWDNNFLIWMCSYEAIGKNTLVYFWRPMYYTVIYDFVQITFKLDIRIKFWTHHQIQRNVFYLDNYLKIKIIIYLNKLIFWQLFLVLVVETSARKWSMPVGRMII